MQINFDSIKYMRYRALKKIYLSGQQNFDFFRREYYYNGFSQRFDDHLYGKVGFKKIFNAISYFLKSKKISFLNNCNKDCTLSCVTKVISTAPKPIIEIQIFSQCYFNAEFYLDKEYYNLTDDLYCKDIQSVVLEFMKGAVMPEYFIDTLEDTKRLKESGENYGDVWEEIINARTEQLKREGKWDDAPGNRVYISKWYKTRFFMPYAKNKNKRLRTVIREVGPIYPEDAVKLEDYYKNHKDSRPKLVF